MVKQIHIKTQMYLSHKGKVIPASKQRTLKAYGGVKVNHYAFLTSVLDGGEYSASCLDFSLPQGKSPVYLTRPGGP